MQIIVCFEMMRKGKYISGLTPKISLQHEFRKKYYYFELPHQQFLKSGTHPYNIFIYK